MDWEVDAGGLRRDGEEGSDSRPFGTDALADRPHVVCYTSVHTSISKLGILLHNDALCAGWGEEGAIRDRCGARGTTDGAATVT